MTANTGPKVGSIGVVAELVKRFRLTVEEAMSLDWWTIRHVYFHPRDKDGQLKVVERFENQAERCRHGVPEEYLSAIGYEGRKPQAREGPSNA